jgi:hypothetical protein
VKLGLLVKAVEMGLRGPNKTFKRNDLRFERRYCVLCGGVLSLQ